MFYHVHFCFSFLVVFWILRLFATAWFVLKKTSSKYDTAWLYKGVASGEAEEAGGVHGHAY